MARKGMPGIGDEAAAETDEELKESAERLFQRTRTDLSKLKIAEKDKAEFDRLVRAVGESTARNESVAQLQARIKGLGEGAVKLAKAVAKLVV